jgi:hypothetical protein
LLAAVRQINNKKTERTLRLSSETVSQYWAVVNLKRVEEVDMTRM